jgi:glycosyltransferase involved in cell wall biosynthesis
MKILFIVPYPIGKAPSQRFRFEQYFEYLEKSGISYEIKPFLSNGIWNILYLPGRFAKKAFGIIGGIIKRFFLLFRLNKYDFIFIHREATPIGPAFFEFIASKILKKKIIYDFDDAIWIPNYSESNKIFSFLKGYANVKHICKWAYKVSCGNEYLCHFAKAFSKNVVYNPTTIDTQNYHNKVKNQQTEKFVIGWTGSHSTIRYLYDLIPVIEKLEKEFEFEFLVISDIGPELNLKSLRFVKWEKETEIDDLLSMNVGIMPLKDDKWANGKCGFKALQYMSLGIPALVSPVGVNKRIVDHGLNGFICSSAHEWEEALRKLLTDRELLKTLSTNTRIKIENFYSVNSNKENFIALFS